MVKSLSDTCLDFLCGNIDKLGAACIHLTQQQKETAIQRLAVHEQLSATNKNAIATYLLHRNLKDITLEHCSQIDDEFLEVLSACGCQLDTFSVSHCKNVTGIVNFTGD